MTPQPSPVYGSVSASRCARCRVVSPEGDVCYACVATIRWMNGQAVLLLQQRRALLRQAMAAGGGAW